MTGEQATGWCTDWAAYNTPRLWAMVAHEDNPEAWRQADAWSAIVVDLDTQLERLHKALKVLEGAWPQDQSEASTLFARGIGAIIDRMNDAKRDAASTASALKNILHALHDAKAAIEPLWQQYRDKSDDMVISWWDKAEEEIDAKARVHMISAESIVQVNALNIKIPDVYQFLALDGRQDKERSAPSQSDQMSVEGAEWSSASESMAIPHSPPPPMPGYVSANPASPGASESVDFLPQRGPGSSRPIEHDSSIVIPPGWSDLPTRQPGPELSEIVPSPTPPIHGPVPVPPSVVQPGLVGRPGALWPPGDFVSGSRLVAVGRSGARPVGGGALKRSNGRALGAMPFGAVIGQTPMGSPGRVPAENVVRGVQAGVKPVPPPWLPAGAGGQPGIVGSGMTPPRSRKVADGEEGRRFDPDNPWAVSCGVDAVIEPLRQIPVHDPGLGVIGQRR